MLFLCFVSSHAELITFRERKLRYLEERNLKIVSLVNGIYFQLLHKLCLSENRNQALDKDLFPLRMFSREINLSRKYTLL